LEKGVIHPKRDGREQEKTVSASKSPGIEKGVIMDKKAVMKMFNKETRIGVLATSNKKGDVNTAVFGSPRMIDEDTVIMAIGDNRSLQYLQENPKASFIVVEPGEGPAAWKGARLYLEMDSFERYGELLDSFREKIRKVAGDKSANAIIAAIRFNVTDVRALIAPPN
jgi:hypothetical protein